MRAEDGFAAPIMLALLALAGLVALATADAANVLITRARVQATADAAALAAAAAQWPFTGMEADPENAARDVADGDGATLEACDCPVRGDRAAVVVSMGTRVRMLGVAPSRVQAAAEARLAPGGVFEAP